MKNSSAQLAQPIVWAEGWLISSLVLMLSLLLIGGLYWSTFGSILNLWMNNDTFAHGLLIPPIIAYLIWLKRDAIAPHVPQVTPVALLFISGLAILWLLAYAGDIAVIQQFSAVALLPAMVWLILGSRIVSLIAFPLAYFIFAVPIGEFLIPVLQDFTAGFVVYALQATGIPVLWEGLFFYLPSGSFEVAKACSGVRYLIASLALGTLYAYLMYTSYWRRFLFILIAAIVPIVANGIRAYGIVMIAHLSDYTLAVGLDHILYGWVFFGLVMFLMFWIGSLFSEPEVSGTEDSVVVHVPSTSVFQSRQLAWVMLALAISVSAPIIADQIDVRAQVQLPRAVVLPASSHIWSGPEPGDAEWQPAFSGATVSRGRYRENTVDAAAVDVFVAFFRQQTQGGELINVMNSVYDHDQARLLAAGSFVVSLDQIPQWRVLETQIISGDDKRLIWQWYEVAGTATTSRVVAKFYEIQRRLLTPSQGSAAIVLSSTFELSPEEARIRLRRFLNEMLPGLRKAVKL